MDERNGWMRARPAGERRRPGFAHIIALAMLVVFCTLAVGLVATTDSAMRQSANARHTMDARLAAESGMGYLLREFAEIRLPTSTTEQTFVQELHAYLSEALDGTPNLGGQVVSCDACGVYVPSIEAGQGKTFSAHVSPLAYDGTCRLWVTGRAGQVTRTVAMDLMLSPRPAAIFGFGVASRGPIALWGHAEILGVNEPDEASVLSTYMAGTAIDVHGHVTVDGDASLTADIDAFELKGQNNSIGGASDPDEILDHHVHADVDEPEFPEVDPSIFEPFATEEISDKKANKATYTNIRIKANSDTQFGNDCVINGVVFIEAPNDITFKSDCVINGVIATEEGTGDSSCQITFKSKVTSNPVETLPDTPEFHDLRQLTGTFLLAPGFGVNFKGQGSSVNGCVAADKIDMWGHSSLTAKGYVINLSARELTMHGNCDIRIDQEGADDTPAGFSCPIGLALIPDTYREGPSGQ